MKLGIVVLLLGALVLQCRQPPSANDSSPASSDELLARGLVDSNVEVRAESLYRVDTRRELPRAIYDAVVEGLKYDRTYTIPVPSLLRTKRAEFLIRRAPSSTPSVIAGLSNHEPHVRRNCAHILAEIGDKTATRPLDDALRQEIAHLAAAQAQSLDDDTLSPYRAMILARRELDRPSFGPMLLSEMERSDSPVARGLLVTALLQINGEGPSCRDLSNADCVAAWKSLLSKRQKAAKGVTH